MAYEDASLRIQFEVKGVISFQLHNKTAKPIEIDWSRVSYVDVTSEAHRVTHEGVRYIERDKPISPTIIPPLAKWTDVVVPTDYIDFENGQWNIRPLLTADLATFKGKMFSLFMPLKVGAVVKSLHFTFQIVEDPTATAAYVSEHTLTQADLKPSSCLNPILVTSGLLRMIR